MLAALGARGAAASSAGDPPDRKDVTITVVDDPDELREKVNKISLPPADDESSAQHGKEGDRGKAAGRGKDAQQGNETERPDEDAKAPAQDSTHENDDKERGDTGNSQQDAKQPESDAHD